MIRTLLVATLLLTSCTTPSEARPRPVWPFLGGVAVGAALANPPDYYCPPPTYYAPAIPSPRYCPPRYYYREPRPIVVYPRGGCYYGQYRRW